MKHLYAKEHERCVEIDLPVTRHPMTSPLRLTGPNTDVAAFYCFTYSEGAVLNLDNLPSVTAEITERFPREVVQVQGCAIITCSCETVDQDKQLTSQWLR